MQTVIDARRAIDLLVARTDVDRTRTGYSASRALTPQYTEIMATVDQMAYAPRIAGAGARSERHARYDVHRGPGARVAGTDRDRGALEAALAHRVGHAFEERDTRA